MKWADSWLNEFKIRGSYGEIGNQNIIDPTDNNKSKVDNYPYIPVMNPQKQDGFRWSTPYYFNNSWYGKFRFYMGSRKNFGCRF